MKYVIHGYIISLRHCVGLTIASSIFSLLIGCSPSITCTKAVDGGALLESLADPNTSLESTSKNVVQLLSACTPKSEQLDVINKAVTKIASLGSADAQAAFYELLSELAPKSKARVDFIAQSSLIAGNAKIPEEQLKLVELEQLGKTFDRSSASPAMAKTIKEKETDQAETFSAEWVRVVETDAGPLVVTRSTSSGRFSETSELRFFDPATGKRLATPKEDFSNMARPLDDEPFLDYFFGCQSLAGSLCGSRDTRFAIDQSGKLRFIASVLYNDRESGKCGVDLVTSRVKGGKIHAVALLAEWKEIDCSTSPSPDSHGEPFKVFPEMELLHKLGKLGNYPDLAQLINFKNKDAADTLLKTKLWSQDNFWKGVLLEKAVEPIESTIISTIKRDTSAAKALTGEVDRILSNIGNLKWLLSNPEINSEHGVQITSLESEVASLRQHVKAIEPTALPQPIKEPIYPYERVSIVIEREIQSNEPVITLPNAPYGYFGRRMSDRQFVVLHSQKQLVDRPGLVNVMATRGNGAMKHMIDGFTRDVWYYTTLSESDQVEYDVYQKKQQDYQQQLLKYKKNQADLPENVRELIAGILKLDAKVSNFSNSIN